MMNENLEGIASTRIGRLRHYVREMFPLRVRLSINLLNFAFVYLGLQALAPVSPMRISWYTVAGAVTVQLLWFMIRVYDELKDADSDAAFARAGDPRFINRPLVTGKVRLEDIAALRWWVTVLLIALNLPIRSPLPFFGLLVAFGYISLTYKWFFWPKLRDHVLLVFVTHMPNALVIEIYTLAVYVGEFGTGGLGWNSLLLLLALWAQAAAFEFSYKIRIPADETIFNTYSKVLGWKVAALLPPACLAVALACAIVVSRAAGLGWGVPAILFATAAWAIGSCLLFRISPTRERSRLTRFTGAYWYIACIAITVGAISHHGLTLDGRRSTGEVRAVARPFEGNGSADRHASQN
jgi:hypothetical protein